MFNTANNVRVTMNRLLQNEYNVFQPIANGMYTLFYGQSAVTICTENQEQWKGQLRRRIVINLEKITQSRT